jgi:hypothetical protein
MFRNERNIYELVCVVASRWNVQKHDELSRIITSIARHAANWGGKRECVEIFQLVCHSVREYY